MTDKERLLVYDEVNKCETLEDLQKIIIDLADETGLIQGRTRKFDANHMKDNAAYFIHGKTNNANLLTREFGIRQQAMYIKHYYHD